MYTVSFQLPNFVTTFLTTQFRFEVDPNRTEIESDLPLSILVPLKTNGGNEEQSRCRTEIWTS